MSTLYKRNRSEEIKIITDIIRNGADAVVYYAVTFDDWIDFKSLITKLESDPFVKAVREEITIGKVMDSLNYLVVKGLLQTKV